jgi:single-stranded-DNA-specific exonuclease
MVSSVWTHAECDETRVRSLASTLGIDPLIARLLCLRGVDQPESASRFLDPSIDHLHDPMRLAGMGVAVDRLLAAVARGEQVAIHGDYDVDGITSTVILRRTLDLLGGRVVHFIPERIRDGYGLNVAAVERLHAEGAHVIVSADCGIRAEEAARRARELGVDLIITDHHEPGETLPPALAVINPKRADCSYPDKDLAGAGVALKLVQAICAKTGHLAWLPGFIKLAAMGTLADVVPLIGENRVIAKLGLEGLSRGPHKVGLRMLLEAAGLTGRAIDSYHVAYMLAPRVNAAGRMGTPDVAMRLLLATEETMIDEARGLAQQLNQENDRRRLEEQSIAAEARTIVESDPEIGARPVLVVAGEHWHRGVIGIVASKLVETFHRPAIVLSIEGDVAHGSCRSIPAFDILAALESSSGDLIRFGGHKSAAGMTMETGRIAAFRHSINAFADDRLGPDDLRPHLRIDAPLGFRSIRGELVQAVLRLAPFGTGNPRPVFFAQGVTVASGPRRIKERHLSMGLRHEGAIFRSIYWRGGDREQLVTSARDGLDVAFGLDQNTFNGETRVELTVSDLRPSR